MRPSIVEDQQMAIRQDSRAVLRIEAAEGIVEKCELVVRAAEYPRELVCPASDLDDGAEVSIRHDHLPVQIKVNGVWVVQIGEDSGRNVIAHTPALESGDQRVDGSRRIYPKYLMDGKGVGGTAADRRPIELAKVVAEEVVSSPMSLRIELSSSS